MVSAIVLAGGQSSRLGQDKASTLLGGVTLLQRVLDRVSSLVDETVVVIRPGQTLPLLDGAVQVFQDLYPGSGPLGGLYTGLAAASSSPALAVACDMPLLQPALLADLLRLAAEADAVVPLRAGLPEPLCAVYARDCGSAIRARLEGGDFKMANFLGDIRTCYLTEPEWRPFDREGLSFFNVNTPEDLANAEALLASGER